MKKNIYSSPLLLIFLFLSSCLITQQPKTGEVAFAEKKYAVAAQLLMEELAIEEEVTVKARKSFLIGECFRYMSDPVNAEKWYRQAVDFNYDPIASFYYALMLKSNEKYPEAVQQFQNYISQNPFDDLAKKELEACNIAINWKNNPTPYQIQNIQSINSPSFDYAPVPFDKGSFVFTSDRPDATGTKTYEWTGEKFSDLYISYNDGKGNYGTPVKFNAILNSVYNEGAACFSKDFNECYFTRCGAEDDNNDYCKIYYSYIMPTTEWSEPMLVFADYFPDTANVSQPFLTGDGKELYVSSDAAGGNGGKDIYLLTRNAEGWDAPVNLGTAINTAGDEGFPVIGPDGKLYFASNGLPGMGGLDMFSATRLNKQWGNVQNLKYPLNTGSDDFGIIFLPIKTEEALQVKSNGLLTSNRPGGKGNDDIYSFLLPKTHTYVLNILVKKKILENQSDPNSALKEETGLANAEVSFAVIDQNGSPILSSIQTLKTDHDGKIFLIIDPEKTFKLTATKQGFFNKSTTASSFGFKKIDKDTVAAFATLTLDSIYTAMVDLKKYFSGQILFDLGKANIRSDAAKVLDSLVLFLNENPQIKIELGSHTDSRDSKKNNQVLSQKRADSTVAYLVHQGIDKNRLTAKGYGEDMIINGCTDGVTCSEEQHQANRRTTIKVLGDQFENKQELPEH